MLNTLMNSGMRMLANKGLRKYQHYPRRKTALILIDVQKEFLSRDSKVFKRLQQVAEHNQMMSNLEQLVKLAETKGWTIIRAPYAISSSKGFLSPIEADLTDAFNQDYEFDLGSPLKEKNGQVTLSGRKGLSCFTGTNLHDLLSEKGIEHLVFAGPIAKAGLDSSVRDAAENDYHATVISDCTASYSIKEQNAAIQVTLPRLAQTVVPLRKFKKLIAQ